MEEPDLESGGDPKLVFRVYPSEYAAVSPGNWDTTVRIVLLVVAAAACIELGLVSNVLSLPKVMYLLVSPWTSSTFEH